MFVKNLNLPLYIIVDLNVKHNPNEYYCRPRTPIPVEIQNLFLNCIFCRSVAYRFNVTLEMQ